MPTPVINEFRSGVLVKKDSMINEFRSGVLVKKDSSATEKRNCKTNLKPFTEKTETHRNYNNTPFRENNLNLNLEPCKSKPFICKRSNLKNNVNNFMASIINFKNYSIEILGLKKQCISFRNMHDQVNCLCCN